MEQEQKEKEKEKNDKISSTLLPTTATPPNPDNDAG